MIGTGVLLLLRLLLGTPLDTSAASELLAGSSPLYNLIFAVLLAPLLEELVFRKWLLDRLRGFGEGVAIFFSALAFGLGHGNFNQFFGTFLIGLLLGYLYLSTGRLHYTVFLHMFVNAVGGLVAPWVLRTQNMLLTVHFGLTVLTLGGTGLILYLIFARRMKPAVPPPDLTRGQRFRAAFLNPCSLLYLAFSAYVFVRSFG